MDIYPTFTCFDDALEFVEDLVRTKNTAALTNVLVVHAICVMPSGERYAHAWVETGGNCIFKGVIEGEACYITARQSEYYDHFAVQETTKYNWLQAGLENRLAGTYGPWEQKYLALTRQGKGNKKRKVYEMRRQ